LDGVTGPVQVPSLQDKALNPIATGSRISELVPDPVTGPGYGPDGSESGQSLKLGTGFFCSILVIQVWSESTVSFKINGQWLKHFFVGEPIKTPAIHTLTDAALASW